MVCNNHQIKKLKKTIHLKQQRAHTVLGSKVNNALNTLTWPSKQKNTECMLDEIFVDWQINFIPAEW